jgi:hypothetical protein
MVLKQLMEIYELIDRSDANGNTVKSFLESYGARDVTVKKITGATGSTDFIKIIIPGTRGRSQGMAAPTLGVLGRLGGLGARPARIGMVSDGDGALVVLTVALKLLDMQRKGDYLAGDVAVCTHICPDAPTQPHEPVPFMGSPVEMDVVNREEVSAEMDDILSVDTTKGNRIINTGGFAISPTVKQGYILKVSEDLLDIMQITTGKTPHVFALSTQDITPYGNDLYHLNSIMQPATATDVSVVGVAITTEAPVPGCATGASHFGDMEVAARFVLEVAKAYGAGKCQFYDQAEFQKILAKYGPMNHLRTLGK